MNTQTKHSESPHQTCVRNQGDMMSFLPLCCLLLWMSASQAVSLTCLHTTNGEDYKGTLSTTYTGKTCQRWDSQSPHNHTFDPSYFVGETSLADINNYCRNPDGEPGPWCYTTDVNKRWELCSIPDCDAQTQAYFIKAPADLPIVSGTKPSSTQTVWSHIECAVRCVQDVGCVHFILNEDGGKYLCETYTSMNQPPTATPPTDNYQRIIV